MLVVFLARQDATTDLGLGVVLGLLISTDQWPPLICVKQISDIVADDTGRAGIDKSLDTCLFAGINHRLCSVDIDLFEDVVADLGVVGDGGRRVDDDVGLEFLNQRQQALGVGDIALAVLGGGIAVALAPQVDAEDGGGGPRLNGLVDDVVAEEAVAADDDDAAEGASRLGLCRF